MAVEERYLDACMKLHAEVKKNVHGKVICRVNEEQNVLNVMIINGDFRFSYDIYDISSRIDDFEDQIIFLTYQICKLYRKCLLMKYFRKDNKYDFLI